ncbi:MAG: LLM class F420-dependent oxidoreductase [Dehalococcoidia bacterium]|jgi:probable F420-dependent oxidoreductase|nr:LLM class F420-dependent oxidoreductase [Dehalococcoidia bacterium]MDP6228546.1 LLM class F420-dependent oxidoreductase [Dehalococcoidia bacterium]MDP7083982.1 LLM class F420-dependent oxidoreductase [Dehalococcoidia bacterium]MDP7199865.1 LLM class F420-dependent oxidoreductase [Dehalococcoidia bacterium]MDP7510608.1 LLM class F420-dependent oxidoreductase [Dehalococcoidia bacterium]
MKFGVSVPNNWGVEDPHQVLALGPMVEGLGFDSLWVMDHLFNNGYIGRRLADKPYYHPLCTLSYLAATTKKVLLGTSVLVLPYHNPIELAKYAATLDQISGGRVTLGVGVGAMVEEFEALGIPLRQRGSLTDESIAIMKELWTSPRPSYHSRRWNFSDLYFSPKPVQKPHIPLWIGGSSPGALRRAASAGDGWHPSGITPEAFSLGRREVLDLAAAAGRDPGSITMSVRFEVEVHDGPSSERAVDRARVSGGDPGAIIGAIEAYQAAGVEHVILAHNSGDIPAITTLVERIARHVIPHFR